MVLGLRRPGSALAAAACLLSARAGLTEADRPDGDDPRRDRHDLIVHSETYLQLFQQALLPGPGGAIVRTETVAPIHEFVSLRAVDLNGFSGENTLDIELSAWQRLAIGDAGPLGRFDGDVTVANVRERIGPGYVRLGRQIQSGGAARFAHFDGVSAGIAFESGLAVDVYGGLTVLPRWTRRPGYYHLGASADTLLRDPEALQDPDRGGEWLAGGAVHYRHQDWLRLSASLHEQREDSELGQRRVALNADIVPLKFATLAALGVLDTDSRSIAEARVFADVEPREDVLVTAEYLHTDPSLFLSRQSVLSVFGTDEFDELGGEVSYRPIPRLTVSGAGYVQAFAGDREGTRGRLRVRAVPDPDERLLAQLEYARVTIAFTGYHSVRASLAYRITDLVRATYEQYLYAYDEPIRGRSTSLVEAATIGWQFAPEWHALLGGSMTASPYASADTQALARLTYHFEHGRWGAP